MILTITQISNYNEIHYGNKRRIKNIHMQENTKHIEYAYKLNDTVLVCYK